MKDGTDANKIIYFFNIILCDMYTAVNRLNIFINLNGEPSISLSEKVVLF